MSDLAVSSEPKGRVWGKVALITGAAQGLGEATARMLVKEGASVVVTDINFEGVEKLASDLGGKALALKHDVTSESEWIDVIAETRKKFGQLEILVNNAGVGDFGSVEDMSLEKWQRVHDINVNSVFLGCKHALPLMRDSDRGSIINMSSIAGIIASDSYAAYNSSKAAVRHLSKSIALHCAKKGGRVRCNSVHPVFTDTPILDGFKDLLGEEQAMEKLARQIPLKQIAEPDDIAYAVLFLASDESKMITGSELLVDGGISAQ